MSAYIESLLERDGQCMAGLSAASVKQHFAAIRQLCSFLANKGILSRNPSREVKSPRQAQRVDKTPILSREDARTLFESIDPETPIGKRDRELLGLIVYSFTRFGAATSMQVADSYQEGRKLMVWHLEKRGIEHKMPVHHTLVEYLDD